MKVKKLSCLCCTYTNYIINITAGFSLKHGSMALCHAEGFFLSLVIKTEPALACEVYLFIRNAPMQCLQS